MWPLVDVGWTAQHLHVTGVTVILMDGPPALADTQLGLATVMC